MGKKKYRDQRSETRPIPALRFTWAHGLCFVLGLGMALSVSLLAPLKLRGSFTRSPAAAASPSKPWGALDCVSFELERPDETLPAVFPPPRPTEWVFPNRSEVELLTWLANCELTAAQWDALTNRTQWKPTANGWTLRPPTEVLLELSPASRARIYAELRRHPQNYFHYTPVRIARERLESWLSDTRLSPTNRALLRKLVYAEGDTMYFSDIPLVEARCTTDEKRGLAKAASRTAALLVNLRITPETDLEAVARYWGQTGQGKSMKPFLDSLRRTPESSSACVSFFFPTFARMRLYTYPDPKSSPALQHQDCFWTAMNFFNEKPDNRFCSAAFIQQTLRTDYDEVRGEPTYGDLIMLRDQNGTAFHMCVHIADDVVFTKNGAHALAPWVLMRMTDMLAFYSTDRQVTIHTFRRKSDALARN